VDDGVQHLGQHVDLAGRGRGVGEVGPPFLDRERGDGRDLAHGCTRPMT
jgi:hypothetical protein